MFDYVSKRHNSVTNLEDELCFLLHCPVCHDLHWIISWNIWTAPLCRGCHKMSSSVYLLPCYHVNMTLTGLYTVIVCIYLRYTSGLEWVLSSSFCLRCQSCTCQVGASLERFSSTLSISHSALTHTHARACLFIVVFLLIFTFWKGMNFIKFVWNSDLNCRSSSDK